MNMAHFCAILPKAGKVVLDAMKAQNIAKTSPVKMARCCHLTIIANVALTQACPRKLCDKLVSRAEQCKKRRICTESTEKLAC